MKRQILITMLVLFTRGCIAFAQPGIEDKLMASARVALPHISTNAIAQAITHGVWSPNKTALAINISQAKGTLLFVFLRQTHGAFLPVDVSGMEGANVGYLGPDRRYDRVETTPLKWLNRDDGLFEIQMRTRAWSSGKRYTAIGTLAVRPDGTCLWR
jgi:hypothetical protein